MALYQKHHNHKTFFPWRTEKCTEAEISCFVLRRNIVLKSPRGSRGEWAWFGRQDSPGNSNISKIHKDRNASFNVHFQPRPMHVSSHNAFGLISSFSCHSTFLFFGICGVIFQSANRAADDFKTYQFVLPLDQGRFRMIQSCEDTDIRYEICLLINYLFTVPMERLGSFRAVRGGDGSDVLFLCQYCELL